MAGTYSSSKPIGLPGDEGCPPEDTATQSLPIQSVEAPCSTQVCPGEVVPQQSSTSDGVGVPYFLYPNDSPGTSEQGRFIHTFYVSKAVLHEGSGYHLARHPDGKAAFQLSLCAEEQKQYPPFTFDRRLTLNNWRILLTKSMLLAGFRLAALQANLQALMAMVSNPVYEEVPLFYLAIWMGLLIIALVLWIIKGARKATAYREFIHPDSKLKRWIAWASSALLVMFAIPNDVVLLPIHTLPLEKGGLLCEASCIQGNWRWPVLTLAHSSKLDHDFTNTAGVSIQLPLFFIVDLGCTALSVAIAASFRHLNSTALIQMCLSSCYALHQIYVAYRRWCLKNDLLFIWRKTACDSNMQESRQNAALNKYVAEGGDKRALEFEMAASKRGNSDNLKVGQPVVGKLLSQPSADDLAAARNSVAGLIKNSKKFMAMASYLVDNGHATVAVTASPRSDASESDDVPWFLPAKPGCKYRKFAHSYFIGKEKQPEGGYGPKMVDGKIDYQFEATEAMEDYPPPTFDRRVTLNNWQEMLTSCMLEAGLRNAGLQANIMMAFLMLESPDYDNMPMELWYTFVGLLAFGLAWWAAWGIVRACYFTDFVHPDTRWRRTVTVMCDALLTMFAMPNDVVLVPIHFLPLKKGGLLADTGLVNNNSLWPVHTIAHCSKPDHDFINTNGTTQMPLFLFIDLGCTITNMIIAIQLRIFNFTALLQMCTCGAYAFVKLREIYLRVALRRKLLVLWLRTAADANMSESRREAAKSKYLLHGGSKSRLAEAVKSGGSKHSLVVAADPR